MPSGFDTHSVHMQPTVLMTVHAPVEDVDRIMAAVAAISPLSMGVYDSNAFVTASGTERYRPREGAAAGAETDIRLRPGVVEISFELSEERALLEAVTEAVFQVQQLSGTGDPPAIHPFWAIEGTR